MYWEFNGYNHTLDRKNAFNSSVCYQSYDLFRSNFDFLGKYNFPPLIHHFWFFKERGLNIKADIAIYQIVNQGQINSNST